MGCRGTPHPTPCTVETIGTQLDERHVKARSCSALAAYAMPCSILLPLALHKKCEKVMNKEHGVFDSFLQECPAFSRVHSIFLFPPEEIHSELTHRLLPNIIYFLLINYQFYIFTKIPPYSGILKLSVNLVRVLFNAT